MFRTFPAQKDAYITDRVIGGKRVYNSNTGKAGSLDLFKLYGVSQSGTVPNAELSRALIKFDYTDLKAHLSASQRDVSDPTFRVLLRLYDVYGGQTTPTNFSLVLYPLSQSFDEGAGRDVAFYKDQDVANFYTASWNGNPVVWHASGANGRGLLGSSDIDVITSGSLGAGLVPLGVSQSFTNGTEDLQLDVTTLVSATLVGLIPDCGFRLSFVQSQEDDTRTRFVKRFGSRSATDATKQPKLVVKWNDAVRNDRGNVTFDASGTLFIYNHTPRGLQNLVSGTALSQVTGTNCMYLRLETPVSGGIYSASFLASQLKSGNAFVSGTYSASFAIPSANPQLRSQLLASGSVTFTEVWGSLDGTVGFFTSSFVMRPQDVETFGVLPDQYNLNVTRLDDAYTTDQVAWPRVFVRKLESQVFLRKLPRVSDSYIPGEAHFQIRDANSGDVIVPFDEAGGSTLMSSDTQGLTFPLYMDTFAPGRAYVIDVLLKEGSTKTLVRDASQVFRVESAH